MRRVEKRTIGAVLIFVFCFAIGVGIASHNGIGISDRAYVSAKSIEGNLVEAEAMKEEIERLNALIDDRRTKIAYYQSEKTTRAEQNAAAQDSRLEAMAAAGCTAMEGPGITIVLDDGAGALKEWETPGDIVVHDLDILILLNDLISAGAEAISINGIRYTADTEVTCAGHTVKISGVKCARPFVFKVIGDADSLYSEMTIQGGYGNILKECGLVFEVEKDDALHINASDGME